MKTGFILITVLSIAAMLTGGCTLPTTPTSTPQPASPAQATPTGTIEIRVTDAPPQYDIETIMVTISKVEVHKAVAEQQITQEQQGEGTQNQTAQQTQQQEQEGEGEWITIPISGENPFDLLELQKEGIDLLLATEEVTAGKYTQIRMDIDLIEMTYNYTEGGETKTKTVEAKLPSGTLKFVHPFDVTHGENTILLFDFDAARSVIFTGGGKEGSKVIVKPVVKLTVQQKDKTDELISLEGTISEVDTDESTVSIIPEGETEAIVLKVNPQTEITLDGEEATLEDLAGLVGEEHGVTVTYYTNSLKAATIDATSTT